MGLSRLVAYTDITEVTLMDGLTHPLWPLATRVPRETFEQGKEEGSADLGL